MKKSMMAAAAVALGLGLGGAAHAGVAGHYDVNGMQEVCMVDDGSWHGLTFPGWGGAWRMRGGDLYVYGNYAEGAGNDSAVVELQESGSWMGNWTEWRDDLSWQKAMPSVTFTRIGDTCPAMATTRTKANPFSRQ